MMKEEFIQILKDLKKTKKDVELSDDDYKVIEYVYANHPLFDTKDKAVQAYVLFGVEIFHALKEQADKCHDAYEAMRAAMVVASARKDDYNRLLRSIGVGVNVERVA